MSTNRFLKHLRYRMGEKSCFNLFIILTFGFFIIVNSFAETGDELVITGDIVNLRTGPSIDTDAMIKLLKAHKVIEIQRQENWVEVKTHRKDIKTGWVHESLVAKATATTTKTPKQKTLSQRRFEHFMQGFNEYNEIIIKQNGVLYFLEARDKGKGVINVIATDAWLNAGREERGSKLNEVFKLWSDVVPVGSPMTVIVFDEQGEQYMVMLR